MIVFLMEPQSMCPEYIKGKNCSASAYGSSFYYCMVVPIITEQRSTIGIVFINCTDLARDAPHCVAFMELINSTIV